ncbi:MAG: HNH endonuclease signature motif containing protein [Mycobacterium sp.]|uniref:HNH endonuclease signature motif containing protein n=1 Tax=Mycobacterium sp. TaxID=1785 RepID=UPI00260C4D36|nr:HNH endonuclease signature motif containing protein [Mycobacterium sp.]MDI3313489.1 HNH endonuclease signature motif containing protein [Mycobacterium sp.]
MHSICSREAIVEVFDALEADMRRALGLSCDALTTPECLAMLQRCEIVRRLLPVIEHPLIHKVAEQADPTDLGGTLPFALAERLRITRAEASRRVTEAADLGPRRALTGEPLPPRLSATAAAQRAGRIGAGHVRVIREFFHQLPGDIDLDTRRQAEAQLACWGGEFRPDQLAKLADKLTDCLNPDGAFADEDRARRRGITLGKQDIDGMSPIRGYLTPDARATIDAVLAKLAAPGMCDPNQHHPIIDGAPAQQAIDTDTRSAAQRNHDGLNAALRAVLASGEMGQHNGLPASIIVSTTLAELESGAGTALTGAGTLLPMSDVIRLASHAHHYLRIFDHGTELALYHTKRLASRGQRIVLYAKDRGCTFPGCDVPGYLTEVHHVTDFADCQRTDIDDLTLACGPHHRLVTSGGWITRKRKDGTTEWFPPAHLDHGRPRINLFHHPEKLLRDDDDDDDP